MAIDRDIYSSYTSSLIKTGSLHYSAASLPCCLIGYSFSSPKTIAKIYASARIAIQKDWLNMKIFTKPVKTLCVLIAKIALTCLAFYVIRKKITFNPMSFLTQSNENYFILALIMSVGAVFLQSWRWQNILKVFSADLSFKQCLVSVWFGHLVNNLMPAGSGGDLLRSYTLRYVNTERGRWEWLGAFFAEKYSAATSALLIACLSFLSSIYHQLPWVLMLFIGSFLFGLIVIPLVGGRMIKLIPFIQGQRIIHYMYQMAAVLTKTFMDKHGRYAFLASTIVNFCFCIVFYIIAKGLDLPLQLTQCMFVVPVFTLLASLPISFAGWGVRELSCVGLLGFFGIAPESAVIASVMYGLVILLSSLPGIIVAYPFVSSLHKLSRKPIEIF